MLGPRRGVCHTMIETEEGYMPAHIEAGQRMFLRLESSEQKSTLYHPIRKKILEVLIAGTPDFEVKTVTKEEYLDDGTGITHLVSTRIPVQRYWMTVIEILSSIEARFPKTKITKHRCYYHLQKLVGIGMVEQDPPVVVDESGNKQRSRGMHFRTTARFFLSPLRDYPPDMAKRIISVWEKSFGLLASEGDSNRLGHILVTLDEILVAKMELLAKNLKRPSHGLLQMPMILELLAWIMLSDDERLISLHREAKEILTGCDKDALGSSNDGSVPDQSTTN